MVICNYSFTLHQKRSDFKIICIRYGFYLGLYVKDIYKNMYEGVHYDRCVNRMLTPVLQILLNQTEHDIIYYS